MLLLLKKLDPTLVTLGVLDLWAAAPLWMRAERRMLLPCRETAPLRMGALPLSKEARLSKDPREVFDSA